jgi:hypothetical protein
MTCFVRCRINIASSSGDAKLIHSPLRPSFTPSRKKQLSFNRSLQTTPQTTTLISSFIFKDSFVRNFSNSKADVLPEDETVRPTKEKKIFSMDVIIIRVQLTT